MWEEETPKGFAEASKLADEAIGLRGSRTVVRPTLASQRPSIMPKNKRKAETAVFMVVADAPSTLICSWKRRIASAVA
jgi:hypothetical protein